MIAVADTSTICYLVWIGEAEILSALFEEVVIPRAVVAELLHEEAPPAVREWASDLPRWVSVRECTVDQPPQLNKLQSGEREAILVAEAANADVLLLDEKAARQIAVRRGLRIVGTLGLLSRAAELNLVDLATAIDRLTKTSFRYSPVLIKEFLDRYHSDGPNRIPRIEPT